jgi:hypothetical protein
MEKSKKSKQHYRPFNQENDDLRPKRKQKYPKEKYRNKYFWLNEKDQDLIISLDWGKA